MNRLVDRLMTIAANQFHPPLDLDPLPEVPPEQARGVIVSFYMSNISLAAVAAQRRVLKRFAPPDVAIEQVRTTKSHWDSLNAFVGSTRYRAVLVLDLDCIPIHEGAVDAIFARAEEGRLVGAAQRAGHIANDGHLYAGPFCVAFTTAIFERLGRPRFDPTSRGDVGEELTYAAEERGLPVDLLWPLSTDQAIWPLTDSLRFGPGTTYQLGFWHAFQLRLRDQQQRFVERCEQFMRVAAERA